MKAVLIACLLIVSTLCVYKSVEKLTAKLLKNADAVFIKALVELDNSDFFIFAAINNVIALMNTVYNLLA